MGRRQRRCILAVIGLALAAFAGATGAPAAAEERAAGVATWGIGQISCGRFIQERERRTGSHGPYDATFRQWLLGFITALNWSDPRRRDLLEGSDAEGAMLWVENHCRAKPLDTFFDAALALRQELSNKQR